jgi:hypothetical protein
MKSNYTAKLFLIFTILVFNTLVIYGQTQASRASTTKQQQWEYLVVSFGKVYFSDPLTDSDAKASGVSKLVSFSKEGIVIANEGLLTQRYMDTLGKFGWELVSVVGAIGGDQEMLFKRPFDENRSKQEEELIKQEGERIRKLVQDERAKTVNVLTTTAELVDLDEAERIEARNANRRSQEERLKTAAETYKEYPITIDSIISNAYSASETNVSISLTADATSKLLTDGNKYRSSEAKRLADSIANSIARVAGVSSRYNSENSLSYMLGKVKIEVNVIINFNGKKKVVATSRTGGEW